MHTPFDRSATHIDFFEGIEATVAAALAEDLGSGDATARLIDADTRASATVITREAAVQAGRPWFDEVFRQIDPAVRIEWRHEDGSALAANELVCALEGAARSLVSGERTALNFLQTLSGTATLTHEYAQALRGTATKLLDTRKTLPGLRRAQKYAVRCGGGYNHRAGLYDGVLIKENHIAAAGSVTAAIAALRAAGVRLPIEIEIERLDQIEPALAAGADMLLLDNFDYGTMREAVKLTAGRVKLEASGGFTLADLPAVGATGVDFVSVGSLTKHVRATDLSMRIVTR
ncbi:MAG TPA: carboxylating nicotinate-nucleotide diphosphorylase [Gammaproteobacteria bacterium]|nr:carboxylating nicotinate-nucleotide diphosphorylase [Gammaproteobacteria bacterium]